MRRAARTTALLIAAAVLALPGCAGYTGAAPGAGHRPEDVAFARAMLRYHDQAVGVARVASDRATGPEVREIARRIRESYDPEIDQLITLLKTWDALDVDDPRGPDVGDTPAIKSDPLPGMLSAEQSRQLAAATGTTFDALFLERMVEHHNGSLRVCQTELAEGGDPRARALSRHIIDVEANAVETMKPLLAPR